MPRVNLTQQFIDNLPAPPDGKQKIEHNDTQVIGLYAEATAANPGVGTYRYSYKEVTSGKRRHIRIARTNELTLREARKRALGLKAEAQSGKDLAGERDSQKSKPSFGQYLTEVFLEDSRRRKRSYASEESLVRLRILPRLGSVPVDRLTRPMIRDFHLSLVDEGLSNGTSNRYLALMKAALNQALQDGLISKNPAVGVKMLPEYPTDHYLSQAQLGRLLHVLRTDNNKMVCAALLFLLATGARKNEGLHARWEHIDEVSRIWRIPATNTKSRVLRTVPLNDTAMGVIAELSSRARGEWLFTSSRGGRLTCIKKVFERLKREADLPLLSVHQLRREAASLILRAGGSLSAASDQLGHTNIAITKRHYVHVEIGQRMEAAGHIDLMLKRATEAAEQSRLVAEET